jgi:hypothetical protein
MALLGSPSVPFRWTEASAKPHATTIAFLTQVLALGLRVWLGPFDVTEACRIALRRIADDLSHA